jgi:cell division protein FtsW
VTSQAASGPTRLDGLLGRVRDLGRRLESPTTTYHLLSVTTSVLLVVGLFMVLSASTVQSLTETDSASAYREFYKQVAFAGVGVVGLLIASRTPVRVIRGLAGLAFGVSIALQCLVFSPLGVAALGNRNWIGIAGVTLQPSEVLKLGLILLGSVILTRKARVLNEPGHILVPFVVPVAAISIGLVLLGHDLGTTLVLAAIVAGMLFVAGVPGRYFTISIAGLAALATVMVVTSPNRLQRFDVWLGNDTDIYGAARQPMHGRFALADGGWLGVGLGASREKWGFLSEPHNDFIFAIIGEELGLLGTLAILALFGVLAYACCRLVTRTKDSFVRLATAGILCWILAQTMINIGSVIGLLPVIGVPLPLVSSGGSSLIMTLVALGVLLSFARREDGCAEALRARPSVIRRSVSVIPRRRGKGTR